LPCASEAAEVDADIPDDEVPVDVEATVRSAGGGGGPRGTLIFTSETGLKYKKLYLDNKGVKVD
jgi:hypothetical protein